MTYVSTGAQLRPRDREVQQRFQASLHAVGSFKSGTGGQVRTKRLGSGNINMGEALEPNPGLQPVGREASRRQVDGQATKGTRWMPWRREAMKDVVSCEKLREAASRRRSGDVRMGKPDQGYTWSSPR